MPGMPGGSRQGGQRAAGRALCAVLLIASVAGQWKLLYPRAIEEIRYAMYCVRYHAEERQDYDAIQTLVSRIPEEGQVYVYGLPSCSAWYLQAGLQPPLRYCDWQPHYIQLAYAQSLSPAILLPHALSVQDLLF